MLDIWEHDFDKIDEIESSVQELYERYNYKPRYKNKGGQFVDCHPTSINNIKKKRLTSTFFKQLDFEKGVVPQWVWESDEATQWQYVRGLLQADGSVTIGSSKGDPVHLSYADTSIAFLKELQLIFNNLGLKSAIRLLRESGINSLPDGKGGYADYNTKTIYRLIVSNKPCLLEIEKNTSFLSRKGVYIEDRKYRDNTKKSFKVKSIEYLGKEDVYCPTVYTEDHLFVAQGMLTFNCTEIIEYTSPEETAVCNLASIALNKFVKNNTFDFIKLADIAYTVTVNLNKVIDKNYYPTPETKYSNFKNRPIGIGVQGLADAFQLLKLPFTSDKAKELNKNIFETIYFGALRASIDLAKKEGAYKSYDNSMISKGILQFDLWNTEPSEMFDWSLIRKDIKKHGVRNSLLIAPMPTASTSQILGNNECFEPYTSNIYVRRVLSGEFIVINKHLVNDLIEKNLWNDKLINQLIAENGSVQNLEIPEDLKEIYKTVWEISQKDIIDMSADRGAYVCQSQSLNIHMTDVTSAKLTSMHFYGWSKGLKTGMYYLRTKAAADAIKFTVNRDAAKTLNASDSDDDCLVCGS